MTAQMKHLLRAQAEEAKEQLDEQIGYIGEVLCFYLDRVEHSPVPISNMLLTDLQETSKKLGDLHSTLGQIMLDFGRGHRDRKQVEEEVLAEIWSNMAALVYFLTSQEMPLLGYNHAKMVEIYRTLQYANRIV